MAFDRLLVKKTLRRAVMECNELGLLHAAKWAGEQLVGMAIVEGDDGLPAPPMISPPGAQENDVFQLAKSMFDLKEYRRCAHFLKSCQHPKAVFLRGYSLFLAGEKRKEEESLELAGQNSTESAVNEELQPLCCSLRDLYAAKRLDGFGLYLYGIVLRRQDKVDLARDMFIESVKAYPWNWSAWLVLAELTEDPKVVVENLNSSSSATGAASNVVAGHEYMLNFYLAHLYLDLQRNDESLRMYEHLTTQFPKSTHILAQHAMVKYSMREFDESRRMFELLLRHDPHRLDNLETYSNILYVKEETATLSSLAHTLSKNDKYRPETCCVIGNYYSLKAEHERAVLYFKRALKLNKQYLSAWTLMGHEFVELKNPSAAIEAYRRAVDINPRDYRAWYGLGQTYEILQMWYYSLFYYRKATALRPYDARMWCAMGGCYEQLGWKGQAIKCYERAEAYDDPEGISLSKLAKLLHEMGKDDKAANYYKKNLQQRMQENYEGPDKLEALLFLANHYRNIGNYPEAETYCTQLLDYPGPEKEQAKALLREIRSVAHHQASIGTSAEKIMTPPPSNRRPGP